MKYSGIIIFAGLLTFLLVGKKEEVIEPIFPELDGHLISLWLNSRHTDLEACKEDVAAVERQWTKAKKKMEKMEYAHFDLVGMTEDLDRLLASISSLVSLQRWEEVEGHTYHMLWEFRNLRQCATEITYPLDELFVAQEVYHELRFTVYDPMMGLYEWEEFVQMFHSLRFHLLNYHRQYELQPEMYFHEIDAEIHEQKMDKVYTCLNNFEIALETGHQDDFEFPCDEIQVALLDLISLYQPKPFLS